MNSPIEDFQKLQLPDLPAYLAELLTRIPVGRVTTYGDLAVTLGDKSAARWVGEFMLHHSHTDECPCFRVVRSDGNLGKYIEDEQKQQKKLREDGVRIENNTVDLKKYRWNDFESDRPLEELRAMQTKLAKRTLLEPLAGDPRMIAGLDISYRKSSDSPHVAQATAAYVLWDSRSDETVWTDSEQIEIRFPYIAGYLAFRELPVHLKLWETVTAQRKQADVLLVDGNGILHPLRVGIATQLGVMLDVPTVGIGKSLLCGRVDTKEMSADESRPIVDQDELVGIAMKSNAKSRPVYVSPGHRIDPASAERVVRNCFRNHRLPEPVFLADKFSRAGRDNQWRSD